MDAKVRFRVFRVLIAGLACLAAPEPGYAQWDDNCAFGCVREFTSCLGASEGCHYQSCRGGEQCVAGRCCTDGGRCTGACGFRPAGCDLPCLLVRADCVSGCVPFFVDLDLYGLRDDVFGPLRESLAAAEGALASAVKGVAPAVVPHLEKARGELRALVKQQKIDPGTAAALEANLAEAESALRGGGLRRCAAGLTNPQGLGVVDLPRPGKGSPPAPK